MHLWLSLYLFAKVKRHPFDGSSGFPSFFAAAKAPFGDSSSSSSYKAPAAPSYPAPAAPSYSAPEPSYTAPEPSYERPETSYSAPAPSYPAPSYHQEQPTHNCSIQEETLEAQVSQGLWKLESKQFELLGTARFVFLPWTIQNALL